jgi:hypothetical protein
MLGRLSGNLGELAEVGHDLFGREPPRADTVRPYLEHDRLEVRQGRDHG